MISVTDTGATLTIDDGNSAPRIHKSHFVIEPRGDLVRIEWNAGKDWIESNYTNFTAPSGGSAIAVANSIEAFLETSSQIVTLGANSGVDIGDVDVKSVGSVVDAGNSTTSTLSGGATFTGIGKDLLGFSTVCITLRSNVDGATDGMKFQFSTDNTNWDDIFLFTMDVSEDDTRRFQFPVTARYFRIVYVNGGSDQGTFRVQTILHTANQLTSIHRLTDDVNPDRSAQTMKVAIMARSAGIGKFKVLHATAGANLKVSIEESDSSAQLKVLPFAGILETGITEIIDADDAEITQNEYSATADLALGGTYSGEILGFELVLTKGSGAVQAGAGVLMFFDADPDTASGDSTITLAERKTLIGEVAIAAGDWDTDSVAGSLHKQVAIAFHSLATIYVVFRNTDASAVFNSAGGDNEELHGNFWFNRWS